MTKKRKILTGALFLITLLWTAFIFSRSMQSGAESSEMSGRLTAFLQSVFDGIPVSEYFIRKLAHFGEYLILALPLTWALMLTERRWLPAAAWGYAILVALCDEFIVQALTAGRGPRFTDVLIDSAGALTGVLGVICLSLLVRRCRMGRRQ